MNYLCPLCFTSRSVLLLFLLLQAAHMLHCWNCKRSVALRHKKANLLLIKTTRRVYRASGRVKLIQPRWFSLLQPPSPQINRSRPLNTATDHPEKSINSLLGLFFGVWIVLYLKAGFSFLFFFSLFNLFILQQQNLHWLLVKLNFFSRYLPAKIR